jgi:hypothetical protein
LVLVVLVVLREHLQHRAAIQFLVLLHQLVAVRAATEQAEVYLKLLEQVVRAVVVQEKYKEQARLVHLDKETLEVLARLLVLMSAVAAVVAKMQLVVMVLPLLVVMVVLAFLAAIADHQ